MVLNQTDVNPFTLTSRPRRNRKSAAIRSLVQETYLTPNALVMPLFVTEGTQQRKEIPSMPGVFHLSVDLLIEEVEILYDLGIRAVDLFAVVPQEKKNATGSDATRENNLIQQAIKAVKKAVPEICVMADIALDPYTDHGHDGIVNENGEVLNDETLIYLAQMAVHAAEAGADIVAPSDMMDGRVRYIRQALDHAGYTQVGILSYAIKYASSLYSPFRDALQSSPRFGDKKSYQLNPANQREALREAVLDEEEGADIILIKPALLYLDLISKVREITYLPIAAYHVSGEYSMVMAAAKEGWLDADRVFLESLLSIKRAGADFILTYAAKRVSALLSRPQG